MLRAIELPVEIKQHLLVWKSDPFFKKMDKGIQNSIKDLFDLINIVDQNPQVIDRKEKMTAEMTGAKRFIGLFQSEYEKLIERNCTETFNGASMKIYSVQVKKILDSCGTVDEYVEWLFNEFFSDKSNQKYLPPSANFCMSGNMIDKFLFIKKDVFSTRKKDRTELDKKIAFINIIKELYSLFKCRELGELIIKLARNEITIKSAYREVKAFCDLNNDKETIEKIDKIIFKN